MTTMDHIVAQSMALRASQRRPMTPSAALDDFPLLTRALSQIHADSTRLLSARATSSPSASPAARLFASLGFEEDRLRRSVAALDTSATFVDTPDRPLPPFRHPSWLAPRAADDARLALNKALCAASDISVQIDARTARDALVATLATLYPTRLTDPSPRGRTSTTGMIVVPTPSSTKNLSNGLSSSGGRRPRSSPHSSPSNTVMVTANRMGSEIGPAIPPPVAALPLPQQYVDAIRAISTQGEARSAPMLLHEAAMSSEDVPHFRLTLDVVSRIARYSPIDSSPLLDMHVWAARTVLEDDFASRIPGMPPSPRTADPRVVISVVERVAQRNFRGRRDETDDMANDTTGLPFQVPHRPSAWFCVYLCLRCGAVSAARVLLERTSVAPATFFSWFEDGGYEVRRTFAERMLSSGGAGRMADDDDDDIGEQKSLGFDPMSDLAMPMVPGCLTSEEQYEDVATEYRNAALSSDDPYMRACYVLLMRLDLSSPASVATTEDDHDGSPMTAAGPAGVSRRSMTAGGKHERFSLFLSDSDFETVFPTVEDYLWLQLWLCRTDCEVSILRQLPRSSFLFIDDIRTQMDECGGDAHFVDDEGRKQPLLYAFVLSCSAQPVRAVQYLYERTEEHWLHYAIHLALSLYHANCMDRHQNQQPQYRRRIPQQQQDSNSNPEDNAIERMIARYVQRVALRNVVDAVLYIFCLRDRNAVARLAHGLVQAQAQSELDALLGRSDDGGIPTHIGALLGVISQTPGRIACGMTREDVQNLVHVLARNLARDAERRNEYARAAELYAIAALPRRVADIRLRDAAAQVHLLGSTHRATALQDARGMLRLVASGGGHGEAIGMVDSDNERTSFRATTVGDGSGGIGAASRQSQLSQQQKQHGEGTAEDDRKKVRSHTVAALNVILDMAGVFEDFWTGRYAAAWSRLRSVGVLPMSQGEMNRSRQTVHALSFCTRPIVNNNNTSGASSTSDSGAPYLSSSPSPSPLPSPSRSPSPAASPTREKSPGRLNSGKSSVMEYDMESGEKGRHEVVAECIVELIKVALHIADYALESGSVIEESGEKRENGNAVVSGNANTETFGLPRVDEIKSVSAFAAMLQCGNDSVDERLLRIERLLLSGME